MPVIPKHRILTWNKFASRMCHKYHLWGSQSTLQSREHTDHYVRHRTCTLCLSIDSHESATEAGLTRVTKFIAHEVEIALAAQHQGNHADLRTYIS